MRGEASAASTMRCSAEGDLGLSGGLPWQLWRWSLARGELKEQRAVGDHAFAGL